MKDLRFNYGNGGIKSNRNPRMKLFSNQRQRLYLKKVANLFISVTAI